MINIIKYNDLGGADHGWLKAKHHFSFASYQNPERVHFGPMRVINDDVVSPQTGFASHPHDNMEIITYVRKGAITHKDNMGNVGKTEAGDVQVMSAGTGVVHSEYNYENEDTNLYQIWIYPNKKDVKPRWDAKKFPKEEVLLQRKNKFLSIGRNQGFITSSKISDNLFFIVSSSLSASACNSFSLYTAPVGLFGELSNNHSVFFVIAASNWSGLSLKPSSSVQGIIIGVASANFIMSM